MMENRKKAAFRYAFPRTVPVMVGYLFLGTAYGILMKVNGYGCFWALAMSLLVYAGSLQYVGVTLLASMLAYYIVRHKNWISNSTFALMVASMIIPFQAIMIPLVSIYGGTLGVLNHRLTLIFMHTGFSMAMSVFMFHGFINGNIPIALEEAACVDGANVWQTYWKIIFPNMKPMHATVAVLTAMSTWNDVMTPLVIMSGSDVNTLPLAQLNFQSQFGTNYNLAFASYLLALLPIMIFYLICQRQIINGVVNGAVK